MKRLLFAALALAAAALAAGCGAGDPAVVVPNERQCAWAEAEIGVLIHFDMPVFRPDYEWRDFGTHPAPECFDPTALDTDQWLATAKSLGAKYAVLVAKHCSGFSLWPTEAHEYSVKNSPYKGGKGDIVAEFVASCRKYGIRPGIYASTTANGYLWADNPGLVQEGGPVTQQEYNRVVETQLTELWSNYGELFEIWFDGGVLPPEQGGFDVLSLVGRLQPQAIAFQGPYGHPNLVRWVGNEEGVAPDPCWATAGETTAADGTKRISGLNGAPDAPYWCPGEADFTLRRNDSFQGGWFWHEGEESELFPLDELMRKYEASVGRNTNMLLGIVVDNRGLVPEADARRIAEFGAEIRRRYGSPLRQVSGAGFEHTVALDAPTAVDRAVVAEDIACGERVLEYRIEGRHDDAWSVLAEGSNIGHKRIVRFEPAVLDALRLVVVRAKAEPQIASLAVYAAKEP